ncbi:GntR family transcriptional regulator [Pseudothermotoga sp.]
METIERRSLKEEVLSRVKEFIMKGRYVPGQRIVIDTLAKELGVSVTPVREALHHLAAEGLVSVEPRKGFTVKKWEPKEIEDLLYLRMYLEKLATRLFIERASERDIEELSMIVKQMDSAVQSSDLEALTMFNSQFHNKIVQGSGNEELHKIMESLSAKLHRVRILSLSYPGRMEQSCIEHKVIFDAIKERNVISAEKAVEEHIKNVMTTLLKRVQEGLI